MTRGRTDGLRSGPVVFRTRYEKRKTRRPTRKRRDLYDRNLCLSLTGLETRARGDGPLCSGGPSGRTGEHHRKLRSRRRTLSRKDFES